MKITRTPLLLILLFILSAALLAACAPGDAEEAAPLQINEDPSRIQLELVANQPPEGYYLIETGALVQVLASGFPGGETVRLFLTAPGTEYRDPVATGPMQEDGDGQLVFNFPQRWDDGNPVESGPMVLIAEWESSSGDQSMTVDVQHVAPEDV